ncbi:MAG: alanine--tRNA ligase [Acidobacteriota bacterium]|jgi:alanyl-tRNA synthetase
MTGNELRERFLAFFEEREHRRVPSSSLVPGDDPTLLFTNAGMNQFKDVFLGQESRDYRRATSSQKCLRVSGKHNDLEEVGRTARHHTFFEMLGNFSFGDYFKRDAIVFARDFLVGTCGVPFDRLWFTVYDGEGGFPPDEEAHGFWLRDVEAPEGRILRLGQKDNFWRMGDTGPCGPCTEVHVDQGDDVGCRRPACDPSCDCDRFLEVWNLVFMQYEQRADGSVRDLPARSVDTGMGLERLAAVVQGVKSNYESDLFQPIIREVAERTGHPYGAAHSADTSLRVIADHLRAITFLIADGVTPSNSDRGYVVRRILRRAGTHAWLLGKHPPFLHRFVPVVVREMGAAYPDLREREDYVARICRLEEEGFAETLQRGMGPLEEMIVKARAEGLREIPGHLAFHLYDSLGLPRDQIVAAVQQADLAVDWTGFEREMEAQRERARAAAKGADGASREIYRDLSRRISSEFLGYEALDVEDARVLALLQDGESADRVVGEGVRFDMVLDRTPFYAEAGGQVGDVGTISGAGGARARVIATSAPVPGLTVHRTELLQGELRVGRPVAARVDPEVRPHTMRNHTATHLLHAALQSVLGSHARQAGSYVGPDRLRFDFNHFQPMTAGELDRVEDLVNGVILEDRPVSKQVMNREEAVASGAVAFFGEKYGDRVRVVDVPGFSRELCGGTHCERTGQIGPFRILSEKGISAGVRRIEAITGMEAVRRFRDADRTLERVLEMLGSGREGAGEALERVLRREKQLEKEVERLRVRLAAAGPASAAAEDVQDVDGVRVLARQVEDLDRPGLRNLADSLKQKIAPGVVVLGTVAGEKVALLVAVSDELKERLDARVVIRELASIVGGGGGGHAAMAEAGGREPGRLAEALRSSLPVVRRLLGSQ